MSAENEIVFIAGPSRNGNAPPRRPFTHELRGNVEIIRTWGTRFPKTPLIARLLNLGTYYALAALATARLERPDVIIAETDPPLLGALAAILKRRWRCRLVYNVRDLYPDIAVATGGVRNRALLAVLKSANHFAYARADTIVTLGHDMARRIIAKGVPAEKVVVIPDWVDCSRITPLESNPFRSRFGDRFVVMYSGNLGLTQQLEIVLDAARHLKNDPRIVFVLIGEGARKQRLQESARAMGLENVLFLPYQPTDKLAESLSAGDLHLIPLAPGTAGCLVPSKVYGILAAGRPFIAMMEEDAEVARIARENSVGFVIRAGDARALARTIADSASEPLKLKQMGARARRLAEQSFDRSKVTGRFSSMLSGSAPAPQ